MSGKRSAPFVIAIVDPSYVDADIPINTCEDIIGSPAYVAFRPDFPLTDSFSGDLRERYEVSGYPSPTSASAYQINNTLFLDSGEAVQDESRYAVVEHRVIYPNQSFFASVKVAIEGDSKGNFFGGFGIRDKYTGASTMLGIQQVDYGGADQPIRYLFAAGTAANERLEYAIANYQYVTLRIDYDSSTSTLLVSVPETGFFKLISLAFSNGFSIEFSANAGFDSAYNAGRATLSFTELSSDLVSDVFLAGHYPYSLASTGELYDDNLSSSPETSATFWLESFGSTAQWVSVPNTIMNLSGVNDLNLFLLTISTKKVTLFSAVTAEEFLAALSSVPNVSLDAYLPGVLKARGRSDYEWVCPGLETLILAINTPRATGGNLVVLVGQNFGVTQGASSISVGGKAANAVEWSDTQVAFLLPFDVSAGFASIFVTVRPLEGNTRVSNSVSITVFPTLSTIAPESGFGDSVIALGAALFPDAFS